MVRYLKILIVVLTALLQLEARGYDVVMDDSTSIDVIEKVSELRKH